MYNRENIFKKGFKRAIATYACMYAIFIKGDKQKTIGFLVVGPLRGGGGSIIILLLLPYSQ